MPLEGTLVSLREERPDDLELLRSLRNDLRTQAWSKTLPPDYTAPMYLKRFEAREFSFDPTEGKFIIVQRETGEAAGTISYTGLERRLGATIGIMIAPQFWGSGLALDAQEVILRFLFVDLGVRVARLWTHSGNPRAIELARKSGFRLSGQIRESVYKGGQLLDNVLMDVLREEYFDRHPELTDTLPAL